MRLNTKRTRILAVAAILLVASASLLFAHDSWIMPSSFAVAPGSVVTFDMTSGDSFPTLGAAIDTERVRLKFARLRMKTWPLTIVRKGEHALELQTKLDAVGIAAAWVQLAPRDLELNDAQIAEYLEDINASDSVRARWARLPAPRHWRERYMKHAKTFVRVGDGSRDSSWRAPVGLILEMVPQRDPTALHVGDSLAVRVFFRGIAMNGLAVGLQHADSRSSTFVHTDAKGRAAFKIGATGKWLLHATHLRPSKQKNLEWESDFSTITFEVRP